MGTTNILDLNNRVDEMEKSYPATQVMMSDGTTSVEAKINNDNTISQGVINSDLSLGFTIRWVKQGNVVNMRLANDATAIPNGTTKIGNIPAGLRPIVPMYINVIKSWDNKASIAISDNGDIYITCDVPTGSSSPYYVQGYTTYLTPTI